MFLKSFKHLKYLFSDDFILKTEINPFYQHLHNNTNNTVVLNENFNSELTIGNDIHEIKFIPPYFDLQLSVLSSKYKQIKFYRSNDFLINLEGYSGVEEYLKSRWSSKSRSQIRGRLNRLETCFNIKHKFYYGDISKQQYDYLFEKLKLLIERRFDERRDLFSLRNKMEFIQKRTYQLILEKNASIFVIYDEEKPIDICLNYHFQNIMVHFIRSYDIDYSKFGLGQIDILKQIEFCFENDIRIFDFMLGELDYKIGWCNDIRLYEHHFIFKNNHVLKIPYIRLMIKLYKMNDVLRQKKGFKNLNKLRVSIFKKAQFKQEIKATVFKTENIEQMLQNEDITKIDIKDETYAFLRKIVYDFQYLNSEYSNTIQVFKINNNINSYIIKGAKSQQKVIIS